MKSFIDTNYTVSDNERQRHRAIAITKPMKNMTGEYRCEVGSETHDDKRSQYLQMIKPETDLKLNVVDNLEGENALTIECIAINIYPEPNLTILYVQIYVSIFVPFFSRFFSRFFFSNRLCCMVCIRFKFFNLFFIFIGKFCFRFLFLFSKLMQTRHGWRFCDKNKIQFN